MLLNYWAIAPWPNDNAQLFEQVWQYDREHGTIAIRWHGIGDPSELSRAEIERRLRADSGKDESVSAQMIWAFYNLIQIEDLVVARRGRKLCIGIGRVIRPAYFDLRQGMTRLNGLSSPYIGASFINVEWQRLDTIPVSELFTRKTISDLG